MDAIELLTDDLRTIRGLFRSFAQSKRPQSPQRIASEAATPTRRAALGSSSTSKATSTTRTAREGRLVCPSLRGVGNASRMCPSKG